MLKEIPEAAVAALKAGNKVRAVKVTRDAQKTSLKAALEAIEDYLASNPSVNDLYTQMRVCQFQLTSAFPPRNWSR
jgi:hypothetical protein